MTSKTELKEMIEALNDEIKELRQDIANIQTMILANQDSGEDDLIYVSEEPEITIPDGFSGSVTTTCSDDISITTEDI